MPFDPSAPFKVVEDTGFDPSKPFNPVLPSSGFDPSKPFTAVEPEAPLLDSRTFEKGPRGFTGPQTKRERLLAEQEYEAANPTTLERIKGQLSIAPLAARGGLMKTAAGLLRAVNAPPVLSWLFSESGRLDESDAEKLSEMVGGGEIGQKVQNFANTAIQSAPAMLAGPAGMGAMATVAGAQTFGQVEEDAYNAYREQGLSADEAKSKALLPAAIGGIVTAGLTRYLGGGTEKLTQALMKGDLSEIAAQGLVKGVLKQAAQEFPEEALDQLSQGIVAHSTYQPDKSWKDIVDESLEAGLSGSLLAGLTGGAAGVVSKTAQGAQGIANKISSARTERAQSQLNDVLTELQSVRDQLASLRQNEETGFTRTTATPETDQSGTAIEPDGFTPIDQLLSSRRQLIRRPDSSFIRRAINPDTDQSGTVQESGGTTPIDTAIQLSRPSRQIADRPAPNPVVSKLKQEGLSEKQAQDIISGSRTIRDVVEEVLSPFRKSTEESVSRPVPTMEHAEAVEAAFDEAVLRIQDILGISEPKPLPVGTKITVQAPQELNGETMPGYVQIDLFDSKGNNIESTNPEEMARRGFAIPDLSQAQSGQYIYNQQGGLDAVRKPAPSSVAQEKQTPSVPQNVAPVRVAEAPASEVKAPAQVELDDSSKLPKGYTISEPSPGGRTWNVYGPDSLNLRLKYYSIPDSLSKEDAVKLAWKHYSDNGENKPIEIEAKTVTAPKIEGSPHVIQVADLSVVGADDSFKAPIELLFDPGAQSGQSQSKTVQGFLAINPKGKNIGQVLIQVKQGGQTTTVFTAPLSELEKAGAITRTAPEEFDVDTEKLFQSGLFKKSDRRQLAAYKLPTETATRSVEATPEAVLAELFTIDPKVARVIETLIERSVANIDFLKNLAISNKGGATYSRNDPKQLAQQVASGIRSFLNASARTAKDESVSLKSRAIMQWLDSPESNTAQSGEVAADAIMGLPGFSRLEKSKEERSQLVQSESDLVNEDSETGEAREVFEKEGTWDEARVDGILGRIEDANPKLYQSFAASAENDKAWDAIEQELVKFLNGDKLAAEILAETIRQRRAEGWVALPVYHGTPHKVDRFRTDLIGTGEGNQTYGWGLYFSEHPEVAEQYQKKLTDRYGYGKEKYTPGVHHISEISGKIVTDINGLDTSGTTLPWWNVKTTGNVDVRSRNGDPVFLYEVVSEDGEKRWEESIRFDGQNLLSRLLPKTTGSLYTVDINVNDEDLLDWDKPLSEQSEKVKQIVTNQWVGPRPFSSYSGADLYRNPLPWSDEAYADSQAQLKRASKWWSDHGIKGIRYLDQGSRDKTPFVTETNGRYAAGLKVPGGKEKVRIFNSRPEAESYASGLQTRNFVIFNDNDITITHENGQEVKPTQANLNRAMMLPRESFSEFPELEAETRWQTGINAKGRQQILDVLNNRMIPFDPELRRIGLALVERLPEKYLADLTFNVAEDGSIAGEFIPWLKVARVAMNSTNPEVAAHEIAHYMASFLTEAERRAVSKARAEELQLLRHDKDDSQFYQWLESMDFNATSQDFMQVQDIFGPENYYLINDDEYFASYISRNSSKPKPEIVGLIAKAKDIVKRIIESIKSWAGKESGDIFDQILGKFERGEFDVNAQGGMLWEQNNGNAPKSLKPISSLTELSKYRSVDQGVEEQRQVNTLTVEQNEPLVGGDIEQKFTELPRSVRNEMPWIAGRIAAMKNAIRKGVSETPTPLRNYSRIVNWLNLKSEAKGLQDSIQSDLEKVTKLHENQPKVTQAQAKADALGEIVGDLISGYKDYLLSEQRKNQNAGLAQGLAEAVKNLDRMQKSTTALERAVQYLSESVSLQDLMSPDMSVSALIDLLKRRVAGDSNVSDWQNGHIPASDGKPGVSNDQLRIAIRLMQQRQGLVQDILTYKQLSDPDSIKSIIANENDFDQEIAALNRSQLPSFLKSYYSARTAKDKARQIYLKHRRKMGALIDSINNKVAAHDWLNVNILNSDRVKNALEESVKAGEQRAGFMSADLIEDGVGGSSLKRTYYNPLDREQSIVIVDGTTRKDYEQNIEKFEKVQEWYENAMDNEQLDPLDKQLIEFEYRRIEEEELNDAFNPEIGKRYPGRFNLPNMVADLRGNTLQFAMEKIGGRAAVRAVLAGQLMAEGKRRVANARHDGQYKMQQLNLEAARAQGLGDARWLNEVADPILASYNSLGAKQMVPGDVTRYGHTVKATDIKAVKEMKRFIDSIRDGVTEIPSHTAKIHPILTKEIVAGRPIYRKEQGHSPLVVPRRIKASFDKLIKQWESVKAGRTLKEAGPALAQFLSEGEPFRELVLSHIYSTQKYPDYVGKTRFGDAYREIYKRMPFVAKDDLAFNLDHVVDFIFDEQADDDVATQISKDDIRREIVAEVDNIARRMADDERTRSSESTSSTASIESGDNFLTKPRGEMIAPDSAYKYGVFGNDDVRWLVNSALEVMAQRTRNALEKVETELREYIAEFEDRSKHPDPQDETRKRQLAGEDWLNYREARQMLLQVRKILDTLTPGGVSMMSNEMLTGIGNKFYSTLIQNLLQSMPVMARNVLGYNLRRSQFESELAGDTLWRGIPRWLVRLPGETLAGRGLVYPLRNTAKSIREGLAHRKALKAGITEQTLREIASNARTMESAGGAVKASTLRHAVNAQRFRDLGAGERYGIKQQIQRYIDQFYYGGDVEVLDPNTKEKVAGALKSVLGLIEETGGGVMLPKFIAPRKLEMFLNADAMKVAQQFSDELELNIREAVRDRQNNNRMDSPITDAELLGIHNANKGDAYYMRNILNRAGLNIGHLARRLAQNWDQPLLTHAEFGTLAQEIAKETNMSSDDNRPRYKTGFGRMMGALTGYAFWYGERQAMAAAPSSKSKGVDPKAVYRAMMFTGMIVAMGLAGTPLIRFLKDALWDEEDMTGRFSSDNTAWRNAAVLWEQTSYYWPIIGSIMSQLYDARTGSKALNVVPIGMMNNFLRAINETAQTGNAFYPAVNLFKSISPNTRIALNRLPQTEGLVDVNNANRILRETADGTVEVRKPSPGKVNYSPATTSIQMAVNELAKTNPDWNAVEHYRKNGIEQYVKAGATQADAAERFDRSVMVRVPMNTVYGRPLTQGERDRQFNRMNPTQSQTILRVESAFGNYATRFGLRQPDLVRKPRKPKSSGRRSRSTRTRIRARRGSSLLRKRNRRLTRGA